MRVAELEDKLSRLHITEADINALDKVAALSCHVPQPPPAPCVAPCIFHSCYVPQPCVAHYIETNAFDVGACCSLCADCLVCDDGMLWGGDFGSLGY